MSYNLKKLFLVIAFIFLIVLSQAAMHSLPIFNYIKTTYLNLEILYNRHPIRSYIIYAATYFILASLGVPGIRYFLILAASILNIYLVIIISLIAGGLGLIPAYLAGRFIFQDLIHNRYKKHITKVQQSFSDDGLQYLFALRLSALIPNIIINLIFGATELVRFSSYMLVSILALLPNILLYVSLGYFIKTNDNDMSNLIERFDIVILIVAFAPLLYKKLRQVNDT